MNKYILIIIFLLINSSFTKISIINNADIKIYGFWQEIPYNGHGIYFDDTINLCYLRSKSGVRINNTKLNSFDIVPHIQHFYYEKTYDTFKYLDCYGGDLKYNILNDTLKIIQDYDDDLDTFIYVKSKDQKTSIYVKSLKLYYP